MFHEVRAPTIEQLQHLLGLIITRIMKWLTRQGYLIEEEGVSYLGEIDAERALTPEASGRLHLPHRGCGHAPGRRC